MHYMTFFFDWLNDSVWNVGLSERFCFSFAMGFFMQLITELKLTEVLVKPPPYDGIELQNCKLAKVWANHTDTRTQHTHRIRLEMKY